MRKAITRPSASAGHDGAHHRDGAQAEEGEHRPEHRLVPLGGEPRPLAVDARVAPELVGDLGVLEALEPGLLHVVADPMHPGHPRHLVGDDARHLLVEGGPLGPGLQQPRLFIQGVEGRVVEVGAPDARRLVGPVEELEDVLGVGVVEAPGELGELVVGPAHLLDELGEGVRDEVHLDADPAQVVPEPVGELPVGGGGARHLEDEAQRLAGLGVDPAGVARHLELGLGRLDLRRPVRGVPGVGVVVRGVAGDSRGDEASGDDGLVGVQVVHHPAVIEGQRHGASQLAVGEARVEGVEGEVDRAQLRPGVEAEPAGLHLGRQPAADEHLVGVVLGGVDPVEVPDLKYSHWVAPRG